MRVNPILHNSPLWLRVVVGTAGLIVVAVLLFPLLAIVHFSPNCRDGYWANKRRAAR